MSAIAQENFIRFARHIVRIGIPDLADGWVKIADKFLNDQRALDYIGQLPTFNIEGAKLGVAANWALSNLETTDIETMDANRASYILDTLYKAGMEQFNVPETVARTTSAPIATDAPVIAAKSSNTFLGLAYWAWAAIGLVFLGVGFIFLNIAPSMFGTAAQATPTPGANPVMDHDMTATAQGMVDPFASPQAGSTPTLSAPPSAGKYQCGVPVTISYPGFSSGADTMYDWLSAEMNDGTPDFGERYKASYELILIDLDPAGTQRNPFIRVSVPGGAYDQVKHDAYAAGQAVTFEFILNCGQ